MTRDETKKILQVIQGAFPNWKPKGDMSFLTDTWTMMLEEYSYQEIAAALKAYIATETGGFAPSIGQLIEKARSLSCGEEMGEMEAWALVSRALRNGYYGAEEEFAKLPAVVQKAVGVPSQLRNWAQTDSESVENVIQSNFMRCYRVVISREREKTKLPERLREALFRKRDTGILMTQHSTDSCGKHKKEDNNAEINNTR